MTKRSSNQKFIVPAAAQALEEMKLEIAQELGITGYVPDGVRDPHVEFAEEVGDAGKDSGNRAADPGYYGYLTARQTGMIGGLMTQRLIGMNKGNEQGR